MARKIIDIGIVGNDGTGDSIRDSFRKVNDNFRELYSSLGLGERLQFIGLEDTPDSYVGLNDPITGSTPLVTINNTESGLAFKTLVPGNGISIDFTTNPNEITVNADFAEIAADTSPQLGGDLSMRSGGEQWRIYDAGTVSEPLEPIYNHELVNKAYADTKVSLAGVNSRDPETGKINPAMGRMSGPLILSRDPEPDDDETYDGLIAATKRYVDNAAFGSSVNLYVALSGQDERIGVSKALQGRALAYAYRTLEAALKRAEELVLEAPVQIGPYKKVLTYNNGTTECTLSKIEEAPSSGTGFIGSLRMSVDTVRLNSVGTNYYPGDILELSGGTPDGGRCTIEVLSTLTTPGAISTYRIISTGSYSVLPGATNISVTVVETEGPVNGTGATFDITFKVNSVSIVNGGSGYSLVSVRITGGSGAGAFGTAVVSGGTVTSITITDKGSGFISIPTLEVNLPRFLIYTGGFRTDFTGDVSTETPEAIRGRDIREGLYLRGETSGALAQILSHNGSLDSEGNEIFDVDIKFGTFVEGETISYGDISKNIQISVLVESGEYYENYPLKVPANVSIVGDEFRRVIFRPRPGTSSSPWAFQKFRRDLSVGSQSTYRQVWNDLTEEWVTQDTIADQLTIASREYGYHYLENIDEPVYPKINNKGDYKSAATLIELNRSFLQEEIIAWMNYNIENNVAPFTELFSYTTSLCKRDVGMLVDSFVFDLKYGGYNRTISAGLKYYQSDSARIAITEQLSEYLAVLTHLEDLMQDIIANTEITDLKQSLFYQIIDPAYQAEIGADGVITELIAALKDVIDGSGSVNYPLENQEMDVFLANDAVRWQAISAMGHGGFMGVLDPEGQILSRSPYFQECASFSRSKDRQVFAGGMFVDGFAGNLEFEILTVVSPTRLEVGGLDRFPQLPCSFIVEDSVYRINYVRDFVYNKDGSTATFVLDETTPWPYSVFDYNSSACERDVGLILDGLSYDIVFGTNYWTRTSGSTYRMSNASLVITDQRSITIRSIDYAHSIVKAEITDYPSIQDIVDLNNSILNDIIDRGISALPTLQFTLPDDVTTNVSNAYSLLMSNRDYIAAEVNGWIQAQILGDISPWATGDTYNQAKSQRDTKLVVEATIHDLIYGGNAATRHAALKYYNNLTGVSMLAAGQPERCAAAIDYAAYLAGQVVQNLAPAVSYSTLPRTTGTAATSAEATIVINLMEAVADVIEADDITAIFSLIAPAISETSYNEDNIAARELIQAAKSDIQASTVEFVDYYGNRYEILMPGNRSMLANDFTQVNDMGYGAVGTNGGLLELVSVFTYYCFISYYSINGAQIRSVSGSSAHGIYALVAEGADPLEVPTPTTMYEEMAQKVLCYAPSPTYANDTGDFFIYVYGYDYLPLGGSELEVDHNGIIYRYPITTVSFSDLPDGVARLNLTSDTGGISEGLYALIPNDTVMTLRLNGEIYLTGDLGSVAVRPSTGLKLKETLDTVYRVLQFIDTADTDYVQYYEVDFTISDPGVFRVLETVIDIASNVCTTAKNHKLKIGDKFIPTSTSNGLVNGSIYYVASVPAADKFTLSTSPGGSTEILTNGTSLSIKGVKTHKLLENYTVQFSSTGSLPTGISAETVYYVLSTDLTDTEFTVSLQKNGTAIELTSSGSGVVSYNLFGLTVTKLRENYDYVDLTIANPGEFIDDSATPAVCTISIANPAVITCAGHGFDAGDVIAFTTTGDLPSGLTEINRYFVLSSGLTADEFQVSLSPGGDSVATSGSQSGVHGVGLLKGRIGDDNFAVIGAGTAEISRIVGSKFMFLGEEYIINNFEPESITLQPYARLTLNRPLVHAINSYASSYTIKSAVPVRSSGSLGTLTIRIALTRVTSHDLLEIGTGSYADTNYPKEIYGPSVNSLDPDSEVQERDVGRCFYVTTDQYGNFSVGPYFRVDQGTGTVTFSASIALSNLDGLGFKRGVPVSEFSTDSGMTDNAVDTVPTENATRTYIERRLGITHNGAVVDAGQLIPLVTGGFMSLDGQLAMKADMDLGNNKIFNLADPINAQDAVNLQSLTFDNFQDVTLTSPTSGQLLGFTGTDNDAINLSITGDVTATRSSSNLDIQINSGAVTNTEVSSSAAIAQSKLNMTIASTSASAPSGDGAAIQAASGLASFNSNDFTVSNGWISLKGNSIEVGDLGQIASKTVLGNSTLTTGNVSAVAFSTVVDSGLAVKKSQYSSIGFLKRTSGASSSSDGDYIVVNSSSGSSSTVGASELIVRDSNGDFGGRTADLQSIKIDTQLAVDTSTTATGGYVRYYGYNSAGGVLIQDGTLATDKKTGYWNDSHEFKTQNGVSAAPITCSSVQTTALTTGGNTVAGTITGRWTLTGTSPNESRLQATYSADLAEYYEGDKEYDVGTVLVFGGDKEVTTSNTKADTRVAGVVSNTAAFAMFEGCPGLKNLVALQGRVPCRIVGKINKGDILVTSGIPGVAMAAAGDVKVGTVVGKALGNYDSDHIGTIEIAVGRT